MMPNNIYSVKKFQQNEQKTTQNTCLTPIFDCDKKFGRYVNAIAGAKFTNQSKNAKII